jgi:hypothetical protein
MSTSCPSLVICILKKLSYKSASSLCCQYGLRMAAYETTEEYSCVADAISNLWFNRNGESIHFYDLRFDDLRTAFRLIRVDMDIGIVCLLPGSVTDLVLDWSANHWLQIVHVVFAK